MATINIKNGILQLIDNLAELHNWRHHAYFSLSLGMAYDSDNSQYIADTDFDFQELVSDITTYLDDSGIKYTVDDNVQSLIDRASKQKIEFEQIKTSLTRALPTIPTELSIKRTLTPYQIQGLSHLINIKHGANFSVPGSGKTTVVYAYYDYLKKAGLVDKLFVVGPFSSFSPWEEESEKCFGAKLSSARLSGPKRESLYLNSSSTDLFLCHYQTAANDQKQIIQLCQKHKILLVVDESHYIKRFSGGVWSDALMSIAPFAQRRVILTGTPMPNGYMDLWSQFTFLWPGKQLLGERNAYKTMCDDEDQLETIKREIRPFFFRVPKAALSLPAPKYTLFECPLNPVQLQIYRAISIKFLSDLNLQPKDKVKLRHWRKAKMVRLMQAASNPTLLSKYSEEFNIPPLSPDGTPLVELIDKYSRYEMPSKFSEAIKLAQSLMAQGKKVILWTTFVHNIKMLENSLSHVKYFSIHGAIPKDDNEDEDNREQRISDFKAYPGPALLIANPAACAESISLHEVCHDAIYLDRSFNCGQYIQSLDRIDRISSNPIAANYYLLIGKGTIDETIDQRLIDKKEEMIHVLEDEIPTGDFSTESFEMEQTEEEEQKDFLASIEGVKDFLKHNP